MYVELRDGFMGLAHTSEQNIIVATGFMQSDAGDDDDPAFLAQGGYAFFMKLKYNNLTVVPFASPNNHEYVAKPSEADFDVLTTVVFNSTETTKDFTSFSGITLAFIALITLTIHNIYISDNPNNPSQYPTRHWRWVLLFYWHLFSSCCCTSYAISTLLITLTSLT